MHFSQIINILSLLIPAIIAGTKQIVKGNEKYIIAIAIYFILRKFADVAATNEAKEKIQGGSQLNANALAQLYRQAMNPSGYSWMMGIDGTNEDLIFQLASQTSNFQAVALAYKNAYNSELIDDLRKELNTTDFQKYINILNGIV